MGGGGGCRRGSCHIMGFDKVKINKTALLLLLMGHGGGGAEGGGC